MSGHPVFLRLEGRRVLVVGGGPVATEKARSLVDNGAIVHVVAPEIRPELKTHAASFAERAFVPADVDDVWLVIAAAPPSVNHAVRVAADAKQRFVIAVDDVVNCTAIGAATFRRGPLTFALSSDGEAPALVALLRQAIEALLPDDLDRWTEIAKGERAAWKLDKTPFVQRRPRLLAALDALYSRDAS